ncbi:hypothetical protein MMC30_000044 [Trapelia coarctata]|nr:hypothetical protein [Trapelia coarctata]
MGGGHHAKPEHLLCTLPFPNDLSIKPILERIKKNHPQVEITYRDLSAQDPFAKDSGIPEDDWKSATIVVTLSALPPNAALVPNLKLIHFFSAGTNHISSHPIYTDSKIPLTTSSGIHGPQIAEWVILTSLVSSHSYHSLHEWQKAHTWGTPGSQHSRLCSIRDNASQRLGVLGYGSIGRQVGRVAKAMGMDVIAYTASPRNTPESKKDPGFIVPGTGDPEGEFPSAWYSGLDKASLHNFLKQDIDWLVLSVPLTKETTHFLGKAEFDILSNKNAFISNISRGQIIVQDELIAALKAYAAADEATANPHPDPADPEPPTASTEGLAIVEGGTKRPGLRGAALDVTDPEPLPKESELWDAPNCIVTPHISGLGKTYADRAFQVLEVNLGRIERGEGLINVVDREKGY